MNIEEIVAGYVKAYKDHMLQDIEIRKNNIIAKTTDYLKNSEINSVVLGISGGLDSSVVLAILDEIKRLYIPTLNIYAVNIHFTSVYDGIFNFSYINLLKEKYKNVNFIDVEGSQTLHSMLNTDMGLFPSYELAAQVSYALRYQMLFAYAQLYKGITFGTTNRDEMEYVGWFGKSSDMMVDLQIISDFHKFEVIEIAKKLCVPKEIISRTPVGDLIDNSSDEDNFGCTYDELAWYAGCFIHAHSSDKELYDFVSKKFGKVEALRKKNEHKYQGQGFNPIFL